MGYTYSAEDGAGLQDCGVFAEEVCCFVSAKLGLTVSVSHPGRHEL